MKKFNLKPSPSSLRQIFALTETLNPSQKEAVLHLGSPLLIIAGAGSGKTKTLVHRVAKLVLDGISPERILLLTFTRKAANEMTKRATTLLDDRCRGIQGGTFHAFAQSILKVHAPKLGFSTQFTIADRGDSEDILSLIRKNLGLNKLDKRFPQKKALSAIIGKVRNTASSISAILNKDYPQFSVYEREIETIMIQYAIQKKTMNVMDYDDLLLLLLDLLKTNEETAKFYQQKFKHILVDEYQDTNSIQASIVQYLAGLNPNITVVGDDCQSIYSFRGANFKNIISFPDLFLNTKIIKLEENYRTIQPILNLTNAVIGQAREKYDKSLFSSKNVGEKPAYIETKSENEQSQFVCQKILELRENGTDLNEIAVLVRSGWQSNDLEIELKSHNIPFVKYGGFKFVETAHVKDVVAYLKIAFNPLDQLSWRRVLSLIDGIGPKTITTIIGEINKNLHDPSSALKLFSKKKFYKELTALIYLILSPNNHERTAEAWMTIVMEFYRPIFQLQYDDYTKRKNDLDSLEAISSRFPTLEKFLTDLSLDPPNSSQTESLPESQDDEKITISTIHSAKGLEWTCVFILSLIDGYLPSFQSLGDIHQIEEERRLLYVALTRAKDYLFLMKPHLDSPKGGYYAYQGMQFSKLSRFLDRDDYKDSLMERWSLTSEDDDPFDDSATNANTCESEGIPFEQQQSRANSQSNASVSRTIHKPSLGKKKYFF
ncbi:UvrD-helicase domain-containing protein [bacterium]|jgi:DNA helicase II / ATP-dependent DNA helicase PcrA|nr:UvrD-helicase domain-containing protein [bacterium]